MSTTVVSNAPQRAPWAMLRRACAGATCPTTRTMAWSVDGRMVASHTKPRKAREGMKRPMSEIVPTYEEIIKQIAELGEAESPLIDYLTPSEDGVDTLKQTGTDTASTLGEEVVRQATEGAQRNPCH